MSFLKSISPEYKFHKELINKHLPGYTHDENSKKSFIRIYNFISVLLLITFLSMIGISIYFKMKIEYAAIAVISPFVLILVTKCIQANLANASCQKCHSKMHKEDDPIYGAGQKVYSCKSCKSFFCVLYAQKQTHT